MSMLKKVVVIYDDGASYTNKRVAQVKIMANRILLKCVPKGGEFVSKDIEIPKLTVNAIITATRDGDFEVKQFHKKRRIGLERIKEIVGA